MSAERSRIGDWYVNVFTRRCPDDHLQELRLPALFWFGIATLMLIPVLIVHQFTKKPRP